MSAGPKVRYAAGGRGTGQAGITVAALVPDHHAWWPSALAAALAALMLIPLRDKLQRGVTRVVYGRWREPYEVLAGLGQDLEAAADIDRLLDSAVTELATGLDLRDVSVRDLDGTVVTGAGDVPGTAAATIPGSEADLVPGTIAAAGPATASIPLLAYGIPVGSLTYRVPDRPLRAAEERPLHDLAPPRRRWQPSPKPHPMSCSWTSTCPAPPASRRPGAHPRPPRAPRC